MSPKTTLPRILASSACGFALLAAAAHAEVNVVRDLGCKLDRWDFDNGPILNAAFQGVGRASDKKLNEEFYLPGGALVFKTPILIPPKTGISIRGNGITLAFNEAAFGGGPGTMGGPASRLVYIGPPETPAITYGGMGLKLDGVTIQRGAIPHPPVDQKRDGSIGLRIAGHMGLPTGKLYAPQLAIIGFDTAIHISAEPRELNADNNQFGYLWVQNCWTIFRSENFQTVCNQIQFLMAGGPCDVVFDNRKGGVLVADMISLNAPALVLKLGTLDNNTCSYEIRTLKVDNNAAGWRLVQMDNPGEVRLRIGGLIGTHATPGNDPIKLLGDPSMQDVNIDLFWKGKRWPPAADSK